MKPPANPDYAAETGRLRWAFLALAVIYFLSASGRVGNSDAFTRLELTRSLLEGHITMPPLATVAAGPDGQYYSQYGLLISVWWLPFVLLGRIAAAVFPAVPKAQWEEAVVSLSGVLVVLGLLAYLAQEWRRCGAREDRVRLGVWLFGLTTVLWPYAKNSMSDPALALCLVASYAHWRRGGKGWNPWLSGLWAGLALLTRKQAEVIVPLLAFYCLATAGTAGGRSRWLFLAGLLPCTAIQLAYNQARWGGPFREIYGPQHADHWFSSDPSVVAAGVWRALFGEYAGLFVFNPLLLAVLAGAGVAWWRRDRASCILVAAVFVTQTVFIGSFAFGHGTFTFGSRFLVLLVPLLGLGWAHWEGTQIWQRALLGVTAAAGLLIQILGVTTDPLAALHRRNLYHDSRGPILRAHFEELQRVLGMRTAPPPSGPESEVYWTHPAFQSPDLWWCHAWRQFRSARNSALPDASPVRP